jgi:tetratricopeptide (TPR) repeat protein
MKGWGRIVRPLSTALEGIGQRSRFIVRSIIANGTPPVWLAFLIAACTGAPDEARLVHIPTEPVAVQAVSLLGDTLVRPHLDSAIHATRQAAFEAALRAYRHTPDDPDSIIWLGRRLAYLGRYREAIDVYSWGIARFPDDARLYRHRGHRYLTVREYPLALSDLLRATRLIANREDHVEPDGLPNARGIPTSTLKTNVWYHLGLTHYLRGDLRRAVSAYRECLRYSTNPDMDVAATHWLYMALQRLALPNEAAAALQRIDPAADIIENDSYFDLVLMYKGLRAPADLRAEVHTANALENATVAYGLARWYLAHGDSAIGLQLLREIIAGPQWAAFGFLAAETDLASHAD